MDVDKSAIKGVIFDKDGTLFDFNATWGVWARRVLEAETAGDPAQLDPLAHALGFDLVANIFRPESIVIASTVSEIADVILPFIAGSTKPELIARLNTQASSAPQVEVTPLLDFVQKLKRAGLKIGVATNDAEAPARAHLAMAGIDGAFDFIVGSDSGFGGKPAPGQLHGFCDATGLAPHQCVMVGDSTHDLYAGRAAGMIAVAVLTGVASRSDLSPHADVLLNSIADLPAWLDV